MLVIACSAGGKDEQGIERPGATVVFAPDASGERVVRVHEVLDAPYPSYLAYSRKHSVLYVASEHPVEGRVTAFSLKHSRLPLLNSQATGGPSAVHASLDRDENFLFVANYGAGERSVSVFPIASDGSLGAACSAARHAGKGKDPQRQEGPHCHCVMISPDNGLLVAVDLGTDSLWLYRFDAETGAIAPTNQVAMPSGSGPRHCVFHPAKPLLYVTGELDSTVVSLSYDTASGSAKVLEAVAATTSPHKARNYPSGLAISPDGHYLLVGNRGADTIATFWIDPDTGIARLRDETACGGDFPRSLRLDTAARRLAVANQKSGGISIFERDFETGSLAEMPGASLDLPGVLDAVLLG